ncbi:MAG: hypothetical protein AAFQ87_03555 [Bacteroidota bacterium]
MGFAELQWTDFAQYLSLFGLAAVKFLIGLITGVFTGYNFWEIVGVVGGGAWTSAWAFTYFGVAINNWFRSIWKRQKPMKFSRRRKIVAAWKRYGLPGISFLSIILSPMLAIGIAVSFQERPLRIMFFMTIAIFFWSILFGLASDYIQGLEFLQNFSKPAEV